jgi:hypothetical protein
MFSKAFHRWIARLKDWTHWPFYLFYSPIAYAWPLYFFRSRSIWFYTASNPTLAFGGFEGERKTVMYQQLPPSLCPQTLLIRTGQPWSEVVSALERSGIGYPFVVKPDIGMKGLLFRIIETEEALARYHRQLPADYLIQEWVQTPLEVSVFYCRYPGEEKGKITALIQKDLMELEGDGRRTLRELVGGHPYAAGLLEKARAAHGLRPEDVLPAGKRFLLSAVANLFHGARFLDLSAEIDDKMEAVFDSISHASQFYYGRYDIKCSSIEELRRGEGFRILEFNGAGSVPNHIYTGSFTLLQAYREILLHWKYLYAISARNHQRGVAYWSWKKGNCFLRQSKAHFRQLKALDKKLTLAPEGLQTA